MRDNDQSKVYAGEYQLQQMMDRANDYRNPAPEVELLGTKMRLPMERKFVSVESIQNYVDMVMELPGVCEGPFVHKTWTVTVRARKGTTKAHYCNGVIAIPLGLGGQSKWALRELVVLHELAHHLSPDGHGPQFRFAFATLVSLAMAPEVGLALRACWYFEGIET
jgi:putative metallohydrolase (TIGR04338 family)